MTFTAILIAAIVMLTLVRLNQARQWKHINNLERAQFGADIKNLGAWRKKQAQPSEPVL